GRAGHLVGVGAVCPRLPRAARRDPRHRARHRERARPVGVPAVHGVRAGGERLRRERARVPDRRNRQREVPAADLHRDRGARRAVRHRRIPAVRLHVYERADDQPDRDRRRRVRVVPPARARGGDRAGDRRRRIHARRLRQHQLQRRPALRDPLRRHHLPARGPGPWRGASLGGSREALAELGREATALTEPAATESGTRSGLSSVSTERQGAAHHQVRRRDPVPLGAGIFVAAVGALVLAVMNGSYLGLTVTTGIGYAIVTVGMVLQLGYSRQLAFSQSVFMGLGAYGTGVLETKYGFSSLESLLAVIGLAVVVSLLIGAVVTRAPGLALALATLLLPLFIYQLATYSGWLGSFSGINGVLPLLTGPDYTTTLVESGIVCAVLLGVAAAIVLRVIRSGVGLQLMAMAEDERLGESLGVSLRQRRLE